MARSTENNIIMKTDSRREMRIFEIIVKAFAFGALYLALTSALPLSAARLTAVIPGLAVAAVYLIFRNKIIRYAVAGATLLYAVLCIGAGFSVFRAGLLSFFNAAAFTANANLHWGFSSFAVTASGGADFLFSSVVSVLLALGSAALSEKNGVVTSIVSVVIILIWVCLGLFPAYYAVALFVIAAVGLLVADRGLTLRAAACYFGCAIVLFASIAPSFVYSGSDSVKDFRKSVVSAAEAVFYGTDSLPEGKLENSYGMRSSDKVRLEVSLSEYASELYLKGFVGSELEGSEWQLADKNAYVGNGYQGLLDYIAQGGLPVTQYSRYSALCGKSNKYHVTVNNVGASRKYIYTPYTANDYSVGSPYYDFNICGNVFSSREYGFTVFAGDASSERVTQAQWLLDSSDRTAAMTDYLTLEEEYRSFVYDTYLTVDDGKKEVLKSALGDIEVKSINTAAQFIRAYFLDGFRYSDVPDPVGKDFIADFFGEGITKANSAYFASAATYIFRMYGYAARYVEGYRIRSEGTGNYSVEVTGNNSHAWTEVYFDGIGWLPIEVTPGFFSDEEPDTTVDPVNPDVPPDESDNPELPPEDGEDFEKPEPPVVEPPKPVSPQDEVLLTVLKVLLPVATVALAAVLTALVVVARRQWILTRKLRKLELIGEEYGRAAYSIVVKDCKAFGGFSAETLSAYGVPEDKTARFIQLIERSVYGGHELSVNEKSFVANYIQKTAEALSSSGGRLNSFICKYLRCLGL